MSESAAAAVTVEPALVQAIDTQPSPEPQQSAPISETPTAPRATDQSPEIIQFPPPSSPAQVPISPANGKRRPRGQAFTPETARENAKKGVAERKRLKAEREEVARQATLLPQRLALERASLCAEQITQTRAALREKLEPRDRAQLLNALDRLLERERILRGIPGPGNFRPSRNRNPATNPQTTFEE